MYTEARFSPHERIVRFPAAQPATSLNGLFQGQPLEVFEPGSAVFWEGDEANHVYLIADGILRVFKILPDGRRVITGFIYPGDLLAISVRDQYLYTAEAVTAVRLRRISRSKFHEETNRSQELRQILFAHLCDDMAAAQEQMVLLARKTAEERVCSFLLASARRLACDNLAHRSIDLPMTRQDMADYLGLTIETVSRSMTKLAGGGVIAATGRHAITIRKSKKLAVLAGESCSDDSIAPCFASNVVRLAVGARHA
jgi:CRP/FNR family transcriptional regulator